MRVCMDGCVSHHFDWLRRGKTISTIRLKRRAGASMSLDARKKAGLDLSPAEEKLVAGQANGLCVYAHVMTVVSAWVPVLIGNCSHWTHGVPFTHLQLVATGGMQPTEHTVSDSRRST